MYFKVITVLIAQGLLSCKTLEDKSRLQDGFTTLMNKRRVNAALEDVSTRNPDSGFSHWHGFEDGQFDVPKDLYENYWDLYGDFLVGDENKAATMQCLQHHIHIYLRVKPAAPPMFGVPASKPKLTEPINLDGISAEKLWQLQAKKCPEISADDLVISYRLANYRQPALTRNFLALARMGFFDGRTLGLYQALNALVYAGTADSVQEPFYLWPDRDFTLATAEIDLSAFHFKEKDARELSSFHEYQVRDKIPPMTPIGALVGLVNNPGSKDSTRRVLPFKVALANFHSATIEQNQNYAANKTFPIKFGHLIYPFSRSVRTVDSLVQLMRSNKDLEIICVGIDEPKRESYDALNESCPEVRGR